MTEGTQGTFARPGVAPDQEFVEMEAGFARAWERHPDQRRERWFTFADHPIRIRVVGRGLADDIFRAFSHLERDPARVEPALTVDLWDEGETGIGLEGMEPWPDLNEHGETYASDDGFGVVTARPQTRTGLHRVRRRLLGWVADHGRLT